MICYYQTMRLAGPFGVLILTALVIFLILTTGGISSNLLPLLYFLSFVIGFILRPFLVFVFLTIITLALLPDILKVDVVSNLIKIGFLFLIAPLAFFMARLYKKEEKIEEKIESLEERTKDSAETIAKDVEEVIKKEENLKGESTQRLNEVLEEAENLRPEK